MKIAVPCLDGAVHPQFAQAEQFDFYTVEPGMLPEVVSVFFPAVNPAAVASFLKEEKVDVLLCGGITAEARQALDQEGLIVFGNVSGDSEDAVLSLMDGSLIYNRSGCGGCGGDCGSSEGCGS